MIIYSTCTKTVLQAMHSNKQQCLVEYILFYGVFKYFNQLYVYVNNKSTLFKKATLKLYNNKKWFVLMDTKKDICKNLLEATIDYHSRNIKISSLVFNKTKTKMYKASNSGAL